MKRRWYFQAMDHEFGPFTGEEFRELAREGILQADTRVKKGAESKWTDAKKVKGLPLRLDLAEETPVSPWQRFKALLSKAAKRLEMQGTEGMR
jgi:GYF domain 2